MKSECFKAVRDFQKVNHFPGTFQIGRKDKLWKNISALQLKFGKNESVAVSLVGLKLLHCMLLLVVVYGVFVFFSLLSRNQILLFYKGFKPVWL